MQIPSSISMAREIIKSNPDVFRDHYLAEVLIAKAMRDYGEKCEEYINRDQPTIDKIKETLQSLNNLT